MTEESPRQAAERIAQPWRDEVMMDIEPLIVNITDAIQNASNAQLLRGRTNDIREYNERQRQWSRKTFGEGKRTIGILAHIRKELAEIEAKPDDLEEWIDVVILALDGSGGTAASRPI